MKISGRRLIWIALSFLLLFLIGIVLFGSLLAPLLGDLGIELRHILYTPLFTLGHTSITLLFLSQIAIFIVALGLASRFTLQILERKVMVHTSLAASQQYAVARILSYIIFLIGGVIGLENLGLNLSSLVVVGGALGLGVGLGLQPIVTNFVAGVILLLEQPVRIGDRIELGSLYGDIIAIKGRSTWVRTNDNVVIIVPNSEFIEKQVTNWTANDRRVRVSLPVGVGYDSDPEMIRKLLLQVADAHPDIPKEPPSEVIFLGFGDNTLNFDLRIWTEKQVRTTRRLQSDLYFAVFAACREAGVEIAFPQRDLHLRSISEEAAEVLRGAFAARAEKTTSTADSPTPTEGA